jgi:steroid delta-isomerase-like uncharacterized protein
MEANKALAIRTAEEVWNKGNLDVVDEIYDADFVYHDPGAGEIRGCEGYKQFVAMYRTAYPDLQFTVEDVIAEEDKVVGRWSSGGTHQGEMMGIPATGKRVTSTGMSIFRCEGGKIVEAWSSYDALGQLQQLGVIPPMGGGGD